MKTEPPSWPSVATDDLAAQLRETHKLIKLIEREAEVTRLERLPVPGRQSRMMYPLVFDLADDGVPVTVACQVLGFSIQAFYN